jgi:hypothetical protein
MGRYILFLYRMGWNGRKKKSTEERKKNEGECIVCNYCVFWGLLAERAKEKEQRQKAG